MPNHLHMLISLSDNGELALQAPKIGRIIQHLKGFVSKANRLFGLAIEIL
jgi:hypothetical protein